MVDTWDPSLTGVVSLPSGRFVRGRALRDAVHTNDPAPEFGLYLTAKPLKEQEWESRWIRWPDFGLPQSLSGAITALRDAYERSREMGVEIACGGGKGRTATAIAVLARYAGIPAKDAVAWVRANYRAGAVETPWQRRFVHRTEIIR